MKEMYFSLNPFCTFGIFGILYHVKVLRKQQHRENKSKKKTKKNNSTCSFNERWSLFADHLLFKVLQSGGSQPWPKNGITVF